MNGLRRMTNDAGNRVMKTLRTYAPGICLAVLALTTGFWGGVVQRSEAAAETPALRKGTNLTGEQTELLNKLFETSGLKKRLRDLTGTAVADGGQLEFFGVPKEEIAVINNLYARSFDSEEFYRAVFGVFERGFNDAHLVSALQWFLSPLGKKIVKSELDTQSLDMPQKVVRMAAEMQVSLPPRERFSLAKKLEKAMGETHYAVLSTQSRLPVLLPLDEGFKKESATPAATLFQKDAKGGGVPAGPLATALQNSKGPALQALTERMWLVLYYTYRSLSDDELSKFAGFASSPAGQWFYDIRMKGWIEAQNQMGGRVGDYLSALLQAIRSGGDNAQAIQSALPPGTRYLFIGKRDPFAPILPVIGNVAKLILPKALAVEEESEKPKMERFGPELKVLETIPLEVYRRLKEVDPALYADLEHFGSMFKRKEEIKAMGDKEYLDTVAFYKELIQKANEKKTEAILTTPLQIDYDSLVLAGVVWNGKEPAALIETPDKKGHTVRKGTILGPNYGVADSVHQDKIVVVERSRDFKGDILSKKKELELYSTATK